MAARRSQELLLRDEGHPLHVELRGQELVRRLGVPHAQEAVCPRGVVDLSLLLALLALITSAEGTGKVPASFAGNVSEQ